jgi:chromosome segregation ATPase
MSSETAAKLQALNTRYEQVLKSIEFTKEEENSFDTRSERLEQQIATQKTALDDQQAKVEPLQLMIEEFEEKPENAQKVEQLREELYQEQEKLSKIKDEVDDLQAELDDGFSEDRYINAYKSRRLDEKRRQLEQEMKMLVAEESE